MFEENGLDMSHGFLRQWNVGDDDEIVEFGIKSIDETVIDQDESDSLGRL